MSTIKYNKLVRDRIPEIIEASGKSCICETLSEDRYIEMLDAKLNEELAEYQESKSMEELADLLEVVRAVALVRGSSMEEIEAIRIAKAEKRGGFKKKLLLKEVHEISRITPIYHKKVDWSLFKDGFAIPSDVQSILQSIPDLATEPGDFRDITLIIDGCACAAAFRNLPIDREKNPEHAPVIQVRYKASDAAAQRFRNIFSETWQDMLHEKQFSAPKKHVRSDRKDAFTMYTTDEPTTFIIECHVAKGV